MTDDRIVVMANIRSALAKRRGHLVPLPDWDTAQVVARPRRDFASPVEQFRFMFEAAGGLFLEGWSALDSFITERQFRCAYVDPSVSSFIRALPADTETRFDRARVDDYDISITRAAHGIAESGTLLLTEATSSSRIGALSTWVHVAVMDRKYLLGTIPEAIAALGQDRAALFVTGPSQTADVEGILIKGVHGPGVQVCCLV